MDVTKIDAEIVALEQKIKQLTEQKKAIVNMSPREVLAVTIHKKTCRWNHTDGCGWDYESKRGAEGERREDWSGSTHKEYLSRADAMISALADLAVYDIIRVIQAL